MKSRRSLLLSFLVLSLGSACVLPQLGETRGSSSVSQTVLASEGGYVCTLDDQAHVAIPPGALGADSTITIATAPPPEAAKTYTLIGQGYEMGPNGTQFEKPATITLHWDPKLLPAGTPASQIGILAISDGTKVEVLKNPTVDIATHSVWANTSHFTWFAPFVSAGVSVPSVQVGGPGGTPLFATATSTTNTYVDLWLGPDGTIRSTSTGVYAATGPKSLTIRIDTLGASPSTILRIDRTLEDPGAPGTPWDITMGSAFGPLLGYKTDASGVVEYTVDGITLQKMVTDTVLAAPGYPSGRVRLRVYPGVGSPIDVHISLAMHPSVRL